MTDNLPAPIQPLRPVPVPRRTPALPPVAPVTVPRDIQAAVRTAQQLLDATARYAAELQHILPQPMLCAACNWDMAYMTEQERIDHWDSHGAFVRFITRMRHIRGI